MKSNKEYSISPAMSAANHEISIEDAKDLLREKEEKGIQKVTLREAPRFMMLSGG